MSLKRQKVGRATDGSSATIGSEIVCESRGSLERGRSAAVRICVCVCVRVTRSTVIRIDRSRASRPITRRRSSDIGSPPSRIYDNGMLQ